MGNSTLVHLEDKSSFKLDANNMPDTIIFEKNTNFRTTATGEKFNIGEKADIPVAAVLLKNKNIVYHGVIYETIFTKEIIAIWYSRIRLVSNKHLV